MFDIRINVRGTHPQRPGPARERTVGWLPAAGIVALAINLRPAVASVGPVLAGIRHSLGLSPAGAAALTSVPVVCFGLLAPLGPRLARRFGMERVLTATLAGIAAGLLLRVGGGTLALFAGTVLAACAIAIGNVLAPALVKRDFPGRTGAMMGWYVMAMAMAAAAAAGLSVPIGTALSHAWTAYGGTAHAWTAHGGTTHSGPAHAGPAPGGFGDGFWRPALAIWALPALVGLALWLPRAAAGRDGPPPARGASLLRDPLAWQVTAFMGLQSLDFYAVLAWLPSVYLAHGARPATAGYLLSLVALIQAPTSLIVPAIAARATNQRTLVVAAVGLTAAGLAGVLLAPLHAAYLWAALLGVGQGTAFPLALTLIVLRSRTSATAARLSAMAQTSGYLIAAAGPLLVGVVHQATGGWSVPLGLLLVLLVPELVVGIGAARSRFVADTPRPDLLPAEPDHSRAGMSA